MDEMLMVLERIERHLKPIKTVAEIMLVLLILGIILACIGPVLLILGLGG